MKIVYPHKYPPAVYSPERFTSYTGEATAIQPNNTTPRNIDSMKLYRAVLLTLQQQEPHATVPGRNSSRFRFHIRYSAQRNSNTIKPSELDRPAIGIQLFRLK